MPTMILILVFSGLAVAQNAAYRWNAGPLDDHGHPTIGPSQAARRIFDADLVVLGMVAEDRVLLNRAATETLARNRSEAQSGVLLVPDGKDGGSLRRVTVESVLCTKTPVGRIESVHIFSEREKQPPSTSMEYLPGGARVLLFLRRHQVIQDVFDTFPDLDPRLTYYRAVDYDAGVTRFPAENDQSNRAIGDRETIAVARAICEALSPEYPSQKADRLRVLANSTDPLLRKSAEDALRLLGNR